MCGIAIDTCKPNKWKQVLSGSLFLVSLAPNQVERGPRGGKLFYADVPKIYHCPRAIGFHDGAPAVFGMVNVLSEL